MPKFKVGQNVRCIEGDGMAGTGWELNKIFVIKKVENYPCYSPATRYYDKDNNMVFEDHLKLATPKTIENVDYPDIIENEIGKRKVFGNLNGLVFVSMPNDFDAVGIERTISKLKKEGFQVVQPEPPEKPKDDKAISLCDAITEKLDELIKTLKDK